MSLQTLLTGIISRTLPQALPDGEEQQVRLTRYGEVVVSEAVRTKHALSDEGSYFVATNATLGTGAAYAVAASLSDTAAAFVIYNPSNASETLAKRIHLDRIKIAVTTAPASATGWRYAIKLDTANRIPTAGNTAPLTGASVGATIQKPVAAVYGFSGAALTVPASSSQAVNAAMGGGGGLPVVGAEIGVQFGGDGSPVSSATSGFSIAPPISVLPGMCAVVYLWFPANATTALSGEYEIGWWER